MTVYARCTLVQVVKVSKREAFPRREAVRRGKVREFSRRSRRRLQMFFHKIREWDNAYFGHLTYPDEFDPDPRRWKRDLKVLDQRLERAFPGVRWVWKLETRPRLSGLNAGVVAPHFHCVFFMPPSVKLWYFRKWLLTNWYLVVGSGDVRHAAAGTRLDEVRGAKGAMSYVSDYCWKKDKPGLWQWQDGLKGWVNAQTGEFVQDVECGRRWGHFGFGLKDVLPAWVFKLTWREFVTFRRMVARWMKSKGGRTAWFGKRVARGQYGFLALGLGAYLADSWARAGPLEGTPERMLFEGVFAGVSPAMGYKLTRKQIRGVAW